MIRIAIALVPVFGAVAAAAPAAPRQSGASNGNCQLIRILPDGREIRSTVAKGMKGVSVSSNAGASGGSSSVSIRSRSGSGRSSVSASSSASSAGGRGTARAVSSHTDEYGRTVTTTHDQRGCRIVVDEREIEGE